MTTPRRTLGRTGLSLPVIGFGCGPGAGLIATGFGDAQLEAVSLALALGIDLFDTAPAYGNGLSESTLGAILGELDATPIVSTKVSLSDDDLGDIGAAIERSVEGSCRRLRQTRLSLLTLHNRVGSTRAASAKGAIGPILSVEDVLGKNGVAATFARLRAEAVVGYVGCTAFGGEMNAVSKIIDSGSIDFLTIHYSLLNATAWGQDQPAHSGMNYSGVAAHAARLGMGIVALRVLEAGWLSGGQRSAHVARRTLEEPAVARLTTLPAALRGEAELPGAALRYVLSRDSVTAALIGFSGAAQIESAAHEAAAGALPKATLARIARWQSGTD